MVAAATETKPRESGSKASSRSSELAAAFAARAQEVFGKHGRSRQMAEDDAFRLWLAWRGDPSYIIACLSDRGEREGSWRVVKYTEIQELWERHNHVEARSLGQDFPEHVLARLFQFVSREAGRVPGAETILETAKNAPGPSHAAQPIPGDAYGHLKAGGTLTVRWPSREAPGLFARIMVLSKDSIQDSKYPGLERALGARRERDRGFTRFLERADRKRQKRWVRWVTHG